MKNSRPAAATDRSAKVMGIHRWIAAFAGIANIFFYEWQVQQFSGNNADVVEKILSVPTTKIVVQSWGITILQFAFLANRVRRPSFAPSERLVVSRAFALTMGIEALVFWNEYLAPTYAEVDKSVTLGFVGVFGCLFVAYAWASLDDNVESTKPISIAKPTTPATRFLSNYFYIQTCISAVVGLMSVFWPAGFYYLDSSDEPVPLESFQIRCWGAFLIGNAALCIGAPQRLTTRSQTVVGLSFALQFAALTCFYLSQWNILNISYKIGSIPVFLPSVIMWTVAVVRVSNEANQKTK